MKLHRPVQEACIRALSEIFLQNYHAEKVVGLYLKSNRKWGARDRRQFAEIVYDVVRWWRLLLRLSSADNSTDRVASPNNPTLQDKMSHGHYELTATDIDRVVDYYLKFKNDSSPNISALSRAEQESIPDWLDNLGLHELGDLWPQLLHELNVPARQFLRVNSLKTSTEKLIKILAEEGVQVERVQGVDSALVLSERKNVFQTQAYKNGLFEMQDAGSQMIATMLQVEPGQRVVDACAGAGGKTLHLAALMKNKGRIIALDIHEWKLKELALRARRAGVSIIEPRVIDGAKVVKRLQESFDRVLLDVPCSGLGVLKRHPDTKWKLSLEEIAKIGEEQKNILEKYSLMANHGGKIVYATCSILPSENQQRVKEFLTSHSEFTLEQELFVSPVETHFDGFYAARMIRS